MMTIESYSGVVITLQLALGMVFLLSGVAKLMTLRSYLSTVRDYRLIHSSLALPFAIGFLGIEFAIAGAHLSDRSMAVVGPATIGFLACMLVALTIILHRGDDIECGCFGGLSEERVSGKTLARASILLGAECWVYSSKLSSNSSEPFGGLAIAEVWEYFVFAYVGLLLLAWGERIPELTGFVSRCIGCERKKTVPQ